MAECDRPDPVLIAPFIVWVDYGVEGWQPLPAASATEAIALLMEHFGAHSGRVCVTRPLAYNVELREQEARA